MPMTNAHHDHDSELLAQRFVDQDLSADERLAFVSRLGRDSALRQRTGALEQVAQHARRLPRPAASAAFVANVLERVTASPVPERAPWLAWLWTPRTMQWNLAQAAATLIIVAGLAIGAGSLVRSRMAPAADETTAVPTPVMVRLVVLQPDARSVHAVGDFNGWDPTRTSLQQVANGTWTVTLPLPPGRYEYMFVVDGQRWVGDPSAVEETDDGFGARNAVLEVAPPPGGPL
jgi:anti-sigma factor RsiW